MTITCKIPLKVRSRVVLAITRISGIPVKAKKGTLKSKKVDFPIVFCVPRMITVMVFVYNVMKEKILS